VFPGQLKFWVGQRCEKNLGPSRIVAKTVNKHNNHHNASTRKTTDPSGDGIRMCPGSGAEGGGGEGRERRLGQLEKGGLGNFVVNEKHTGERFCQGGPQCRQTVRGGGNVRQVSHVGGEMRKTATFLDLAGPPDGGWKTQIRQEKKGAVAKGTGDCGLNR